jgi:hypothetical protein
MRARGVRGRCAIVWLTALLAWVAGPAGARADEPPRCAEGEARRRLAELRAAMDDEAERAVAWSSAWVATGATLAFASFTRAALTRDEDDRIDPLVSGVASLFIPAAILARPLRVIADREALRVEAEPDGDACAALARAETRVAESAEDEADKAGPLAHAVNIGGNVAIGLLLALVFHHGWAGLLNGAGGIALGELQIATQPTGLVARAHAQEAGAAGGAALPAWQWSIAPVLAGPTRGLSLRIAF